MKKLIASILSLSLALVPLAVVTPVRAAADTCTWTGLGADTNFSTVENWTGCDGAGTPENGDSVDFPASADLAKREVYNDMVDLSIANITFSGTAEDASVGYVLTGNELFVGGSLVNISDLDIVIDLSIGLTSNTIINAGTKRMKIGSIESNTTLDLATFDLLISDSFDSLSCEYVSLYSNLVGSGQLTVNTDFANFMGQGSGFTGPVTVSAGSSAYFNEMSLGSTSGMTVQQGSEIVLVATEDVTFDFPLIIGGAGKDGESAAIATSYNYMQCAGGGSPDKAKTTFAGDVTLTANTVFGGHNDLVITGSYTPGSYKMSVLSGSLGSLTTPLGTDEAPKETITVAPDDKDADQAAYVNNNQTLILNGERGLVYVGIGGTLKGLGKMGSLSMYGGTLAPGQSPGCLTSGNTTITDSTYQVEIEGTERCTQYDSMTVNGSLDINNTSLVILRSSEFVPELNDSFIIFENDGADAVDNTFAGLAQGATTVVDGVTYTVSYTGGDGNDVVLVVTGGNAAPDEPDTGFRLLKANVVLPLVTIMAAMALLGILLRLAHKK